MFILNESLAAVSVNRILQYYAHHFQSCSKLCCWLQITKKLSKKHAISPSGATTPEHNEHDDQQGYHSRPGRGAADASDAANPFYAAQHNRNNNHDVESSGDQLHAGAAAAAVGRAKQQGVATSQLTRRVLLDPQEDAEGQLNSSHHDIQVSHDSVKAYSTSAMSC